MDDMEFVESTKQSATPFTDYNVRNIAKMIDTHSTMGECDVLLLLCSIYQRMKKLDMQDSSDAMYEAIETLQQSIVQSDACQESISECVNDDYPYWMGFW